MSLQGACTGRNVVAIVNSATITNVMKSPLICAILCDSLHSSQSEDVRTAVLLNASIAIGCLWNSASNPYVIFLVIPS